MLVFFHVPCLHLESNDDNNGDGAKESKRRRSVAVNIDSIKNRVHDIYTALARHEWNEDSAEFSAV